MANRSVWLIFFEGIKIFALNIHKFMLYMAFPVLGQILGIFLIFGLTFWFTQNMQDIAAKYDALNNMSSMITLIVVSVIPGVLILIKAFWDYLVAFVALNSMTEGYLNTGRVYDFKAHNSVATQKSFSFITIWFLISIMTILGILPVFWIFAGLFFVYFILVFQVFTFENGLSPVGYFKRSMFLIKGKFGRTFLLMAILTIFTYVILVSGLGVLFDAFNWTNPLAKMFEAWAYTLPIDPLEQYGVTPSVIGTELVKQLIFFLAIGFSLPIRSICWTLWYNELASEDEPVVKKPKKRVKKATTSQQKPVAKTFKIEKRGIDPEIIRRARLEDDEY
ncbi:hypothetical protein BHV42_02660 [Candidatus Melainabacteria bacterium MEL.A1]|jgi:hypothetical protein|nr:hypothetical protein BHV42_02660 [Candidatus Melainabacteria bacterium MEL.A1]CCX79007.1 unknown [Clostridium sp. CAG:715]DAA83754.1 MAG TPA: hypothetical protein CPT82_05715 [Candidatus Gastranaerophilales bacterium HUM_2]